MPKLVGRAVATDLIFTARTISGEEAFQLGIASRISQDETAFDKAAELMSLVAENAPLALRAGKKAMNHCATITSLKEAFDASRQFRDPLSHTADHREALAAFAEKRRPVFTGK